MMPVASNSETEARLLVSAVTAMLKRRVDEATEVSIREAVSAFEAKLRREVALAAMDVSNFYEIDRDRGGVSIRVKLT